MKEMILLVPGANGTELIRMLARFGVNSLGLRIMNAPEFARFALMRSGVIPEAGFLPRKQEPAVVDSFIREIPYFSSAGYADSEKIADALYRLRSLIPEQEAPLLHSKLPAGEFPEKNKSLVAVYDRYLATLQAAGNTDTIGLLRKALAEAAPLPMSVCTLREYPLSPLEEALVSHLAPSRTESSLPQLLGRSGTSPQKLDYTECYGSSNEVEAIYSYILENKLPFDQCVVAVASPAPYAQLFYDFSQNHDLPITLGCGIPILNANPAKLLKLLYDWYTTGYHGVDALRALLCSDALDQKKLFGALGIETFRELDQVISLAGHLRLSFDREENRQKLDALPPDGELALYYPCVEALAEELALGESKLIEKYALIRIREGAIGRVDRSALSVICDALDAYAKYAGGSSLEQLIPQILQRSVCSENSREGALFVTGISGAMASMRPHLFLVGMSAASFPGMPRENYLLLDSDYLLFASRQTAPTSTNLVQQKKDTLSQLLMLAAALDVRVHISYSGYDLSALQAENPSSVLFDIFRKQLGEAADTAQFQKVFRHVGYFGQKVSTDHLLGKAYVLGQDILFQEPVLSEAPCSCSSGTAFSPTAIDLFFKCPLHFFLNRILGIPDQEEDDPFTVISAAEIGDLAHELMEGLSKDPCDRNTFSQRAAAAFDRFLLTRPPIHKAAADGEKRAFRKMMETAYEFPKNHVVTAEEGQSSPHSSGVLLYGKPDRVEKTPEGEYIIADFKTGRKVEHQPHDIDTCLQVVIYAYLMEQQGFPISRCEYRYLRDGLTIPCRYDADMKDKLDAKLQEFKKALDSGIFPATPSDRACRYCKMKSFCADEADKKEETA